MSNNAVEKSVETTPLASMQSVHTRSFVELLDRLGISLIVSTYQAGRVVILRASGPTLNTHFREFKKPMGIAERGGRLAIGSAGRVWEFHDVPAVGRRVDVPGLPTCDACYLPRTAHYSGDVQIHEMAWAQDRLWFVNTRFSCLCTRATSFNFVPVWKPSFISRLAAEDRCHLNGLGLRDGYPRYVTAMGTGDAANSWRQDKRTGGVVIDVSTNQVVCRGLSMPHSPRWHDGALWVLSSGDGQLNRVDESTGRLETVAALPGFTRGLDFAGRYAFVGLSQVRETAIFSGIAVADRPDDQRQCGVWAVDLQTGRIAGFVRFEQDVREIFAVQVLHRRWPDLLTDDDPILADSFVLPDEALAMTAGG